MTNELEIYKQQLLSPEILSQGVTSQAFDGMVKGFYGQTFDVKRKTNPDLVSRERKIYEISSYEGVLYGNLEPTFIPFDDSSRLIDARFKLMPVKDLYLDDSETMQYLEFLSKISSNYVNPIFPNSVMKGILGQKGENGKRLHRKDQMFLEMRLGQDISKLPLFFNDSKSLLEVGKN